MKTFKEFMVETHGIKSLSKALVKLAEHIGYNHDGDNNNYSWFWCGTYGDCALCDTAGDEMTLSIYDFFRLTKEDVIVEPERFECELAQKIGLNCKTTRVDLTQDQINRIFEVMNEQ